MHLATYEAQTQRAYDKVHWDYSNNKSFNFIPMQFYSFQFRSLLRLEDAISSKVSNKRTWWKKFVQCCFDVVVELFVEIFSINLNAHNMIEMTHLYLTLKWKIGACTVIRYSWSTNMMPNLFSCSLKGYFKP